jgi:hypothetical protein
MFFSYFKRTIYITSVRMQSVEKSAETYEGGPKYFRNLDLTCEQDIVQVSGTMYHELTMF